MIAAALCAAIVLASGTTADLVIGQPNFTSDGAGFDSGQVLDSPVTVAIDTSVTPNRVYVSDYNNNRVLGWNDAATLTNGETADLVLGQPDFISAVPNNSGESASTLNLPQGVVVDGSGNLYVADSGNNRVLEYDTPFAACDGSFPCVGPAASKVAGTCTGFTSYTCDGVSAYSLSGPAGLALNGGDLWVADAGDDRVLEFNTPLASLPSLPKAVAVIGQSTLEASGCNSDTSGGNPTAIDLCHPYALAFDGSGHLYVADESNNRVLEYNTPLTSTTANRVFGQGGSFKTNECDYDIATHETSTAIDLCNPTGVALDPSGDLWVVDQTNNRVLEYNTPLTNTTANTVFGQGGSFTSNACNSDTGSKSISSAIDLCTPGGVALDPSGNLWVADQGNNRVLKYDNPLESPSPTPTTTRTATPTPTATATATSTGSATPTATATASSTPSATATATPTASATSTGSPTASATATATRSATPTATATSTGSATATPTVTNTATATQTATATASPTKSATATPTATATVTPTATPTPSTAKLVISPKSLNFGKSTKVGSVSKPKKVTIKNASSKKSGITVRITGESPVAPFTVTSECNTTLEPGKSCKVSVTFSPTDTTEHTGNLTIDDNEAGAPQEVPLSGTGKAAKK